MMTESQSPYASFDGLRRPSDTKVEHSLVRRIQDAICASRLDKIDKPACPNRHPEGAGSIFVEKAEDDVGKKIAQVSVTISDKGKAIGAITLGIDVGKLK